MMNEGHPLAELLAGINVVLGSQSPRRVELLKSLDIPFEVRSSDAPEDHALEVDPYELPITLATRKASYLQAGLKPNELLITADTVVILKQCILEKPKSISEAKHFLHELSGNWHEVVTGYCLTYGQHQFKAEVTSNVLFNELTECEIDYYISHYEVMDKAGAYGIQDWIGLVGVAEINGSYHNVMGLPIAHLYQNLKSLLHQL